MVVIKHFDSFCSANIDITIIKGIERIPCPICGGDLFCISTCNRKGIRDNDNINVYRLRKLRCKECRKIHLELPYFLIPRKRYEADIYQLILEDKDDGINFDEYTRRDARKWAIICLTEFLSLHELSILEQVSSISYLKELIAQTKLIFPEGNWLARVCCEIYKTYPKALLGRKFFCYPKVNKT